MRAGAARFVLALVWQKWKRGVKSDVTMKFCEVFFACGQVILQPKGWNYLQRLWSHRRLYYFPPKVRPNLARNRKRTDFKRFCAVKRRSPKVGIYLHHLPQEIGHADNVIRCHLFSALKLPVIFVPMKRLTWNSQEWKRTKNCTHRRRLGQNVAPSSDAKGPEVKFANLAQNGQTPREQVILHALCDFHPKMSSSLVVINFWKS